MNFNSRTPPILKAGFLLSYQIFVIPLTFPFRKNCPIWLFPLKAERKTLGVLPWLQGGRNVSQKTNETLFYRDIARTGTDIRRLRIRRSLIHSHPKLREGRKNPCLFESGRCTRKNCHHPFRKNNGRKTLFREKRQTPVSFPFRFQVPYSKW